MGEVRSALRQAPVTASVTARRRRLASPATAVALGVLTLAELAATLVLTGADHQLTWSLTVRGPFAVLIFAAVGVVVACRQPRNPVGWILICFGLLFLLSVAAGLYAALAYRRGPVHLPLAAAAIIVAQPAAIVAFGLVLLVVLLFPDGRLTRRWRPVLWVYAGLNLYLALAGAAPAVAAVASRDVHVDASGDLTDTGRLTGWLVHQPGGLSAGVNIAVGVLCLSFVGHQVISWRRAAGERRQQLKWLAFGAAITLVLGVLASGVTSGWVSEALGVTIVALPAGIGVGILRYRLYDIDRIISRTVAYTLVTGVLVGVYAGLVLLATEVLTIKSPVAVAAATLAVAALFSPLRHRVQRVVDRRFNRARYDADRTLAAFAARLKDAVDLDAVREDLAGAVTAALEPAHVTVWIRDQP